MINAVDTVVREAALLEPLLSWLRGRRVLRDDTVIVSELPWYGRRVDLAILNRSNMTTAYELKLRQTRRALEQGALNSLSFDRSYIVTASKPSQRNLVQAVQLGVGVILISPDSGRASALLVAPQGRVNPTVRNRLHSAMTSTSRHR